MLTQKQQLKALFPEVENDAQQISEYLFANPELGCEEYLACDYLCDKLSKHNFKVTKGIYNYNTAFKAEFCSDKPGRTVAFMCEYDALRNIGHGCGHNHIAAMSAGAGILLSKILKDIGGKIVVFGTPAEETMGAKVELAKQGAFSEIDAAMLIHPESYTHRSGVSLAMDSLEFRFFGKSAHAASAPENGINALDAATLMFHGVNCMRQHVMSDVRLHGVIKEGGTAPNVVPEYAVVHYYVRARRREYLDVVVKKVIDCAKGAAIMTGSRLEYFNNEVSYDDMMTNEALSDCFSENLLLAGEPVVLPMRDSFGSIDMGNVSKVCPSIHSYLAITDVHISGHTREFAEATQTDRAKIALNRGILALSFTGYDIIENNELAAMIREEFNAQQQYQR
ncbi:MAG: M20 family metallopeptidase [Negativicutes bacterium]|jgi:amidohydrolase